MASALDVEFARRYYRWFWKGSISTIAFSAIREQAKKAGPVRRRRYRLAVQAAYKVLDLTKATWDDDPDETICEVCLRRNVPTLLVKIDGKGPISRDSPGDLVCGRCHPDAATRLEMLQLESLTG